MTFNFFVVNMIPWKLDVGIYKKKTWFQLTNDKSILYSCDEFLLLCARIENETILDLQISILIKNKHLEFLSDF